MPTLQESNKALMREFIAAVQNGHNVDAMDRFYAPDFINYDNPPGFTGSREDTKAIHRLFFAAFPDMRVEILDMAAEGDKVWTCKQFSGTHTGDWPDIPATGQAVSFRVIDIMTFRDGLVTKHWMATEMPAVLMQLKAVAEEGIA